MRHRDDVHPEWCGGGHVCSIDRPTGEHRSQPLTVDTRVGRVVATRIQTRRGGNRLELRTVLDLPADDQAARDTAAAVMARLEHALTLPTQRSTR